MRWLPGRQRPGRRERDIGSDLAVANPPPHAPARRSRALTAAPPTRSMARQKVKVAPRDASSWNPFRDRMRTSQRAETANAPAQSPHHERTQSVCQGPQNALSNSRYYECKLLYPGSFSHRYSHEKKSRCERRIGRRAGLGFAVITILVIGVKSSRQAGSAPHAEGYRKSLLSSASSSVTWIPRFTTWPLLSTRIIVGSVRIPISFAKRLSKPPGS
jgi:hypothetical protein